ncbi:hypothetical protein TWF730_007314 [Orbilia blumenaviensis]|uniref:Uncharacterized protein n=1 Tax=Orbilia blumenaviensis TaxID=1796055 RepID=A0AAV9V8K2_9PEZI
MHRLGDVSTQTTSERVIIRPSIAIIQDLDCLLYLISGLLEYDDRGFQTLADLENQPFLQDDQPSSSLMPTSAQKARIGIPLNGYAYTYPSDISILANNVSMLRETKSAYMHSLSKALEAFREEAKVAVEYNIAKKRYCDVYALENILRDSPETYKTAAICERHGGLGATQRSRTISPNEKKCGWLFLAIKSSTIPSYGGLGLVQSVSLGDIEKAEMHLSDFIKRLESNPSPPLPGQYFQEPPGNVTLHQNTYGVGFHSIDPLWHRALILAERNGLVQEALVSQSVEKIIWQRNLLGETSIHLAFRKVSQTSST